MERRDYLDEVRGVVLERTKTDRIMWFSMWFLSSIVTFGLATFPMVYLLVERRNRHFQRQEKLENLLTSVLGSEEVELENEAKTPPSERRALLWALSIILVVPLFLVAYYLSKDLLLHERRQKDLFNKVLPGEKISIQELNLKLYLALTVVTLGLGVVYWFYKIFNAYNRHFKEQWRLEDKLLRALEEMTKPSSRACDRNA